MDRTLVYHLGYRLVEVAHPEKSLLDGFIVQIQHVSAGLVKRVRDKGLSFFLAMWVLL